MLMMVGQKTFCGSNQLQYFALWAKIPADFVMQAFCKLTKTSSTMTNERHNPEIAGSSAA